MRRTLRPPVTPLVLLCIFFLIPALFPSLLAPHDPISVDLSAVNQPPAWAGGDSSNLLGTDGLGRDVLSRLIHGARLSAFAALVVIALSMVLGSAIGAIAGYLGGWTDIVLMRLADAHFSLPLVLVALAMATLIGPSFGVSVTVMVMVLWAQYARLVRGECVAVKEREYVTYARIIGLRWPTIVWRHIRPMVQNQVVVLATLHVGWVILVEAALSFIGAGVPPPNPAWGVMIAEGRTGLVSNWWISAFPGLVIVLVIMSVNLLGDWLRDRTDPRWAKSSANEALAEGRMAAV